MFVVELDGALTMMTWRELSRYLEPGHVVQLLLPLGSKYGVGQRMIVHENSLNEMQPHLYIAEPDAADLDEDMCTIVGPTNEEEWDEECVLLRVLN